MTDYPQPSEPITVPPASSLTFADRFRIKAATGIGITEAAMAGDLDTVTAALAWFAAANRPEYPGITWENVTRWTPGAVTFSDEPDLDAADLAAAAEPMTAEHGTADGPPFTDPREPESG
jgi:hypothetical protein